MENIWWMFECLKESFVAVIIPPVHTGCEVILSQHAYPGGDGGQNPQDEVCGKKFILGFLSLCCSVALQGNTKREFGAIKNFGRSQLDLWLEESSPQPSMTHVNISEDSVNTVRCRVTCVPVVSSGRWVQSIGQQATCSWAETQENFTWKLQSDFLLKEERSSCFYTADRSGFCQQREETMFFHTEHLTSYSTISAGRESGFIQLCSGSLQTLTALCSG